VLLLLQLNLTLIKVQVILGFIVGGVLGNLADRLFRGYVVDYIDILSFINYPVFNLADVFITLGIFYIVIFYGIINKETNN